ncbi:MAG TPA: 16S rRNA (cytosine(1402)-N(4))-methyltransferase RsmH [Anaerolineae bacterium]|nr:16S rRNA (cytosine(1402)-N(4))-methyltransferase RsmH [Anaerolineae bacterium]
MEGSREHVPVLYDEVLAGLQVRPGGSYLDGTLGAAGHAAGILQASTPGGTLLGLDADPEAIAFAREVLRPFGSRATLRVANFRHMAAVARAEGLTTVDGILLDLGLSSRQLANAERGFSFSQEGPLDMRMDPGSESTAARLVNSLPEQELADLLWRYGEEHRSRRIARAIVAARPVTSTAQLAAIVARSAGGGQKIHPATRTFQALRIAVNDELQALADVLPQALDLLRPGGRLAIISFHSLEDRLVKQYFQQESRDCICPPELPVCTCGHKATLAMVNRKPIRPTEDEVERNPRSRSARLRVAERLPAQPVTAG